MSIFPVTIRVTSVPFPPADLRSNPKLHSVLAHCSLSDTSVVKNEHPDVPGMHDAASSDSASGNHDDAIRPSRMFVHYVGGGFRQRNPDGYIQPPYESGRTIPSTNDAIEGAFVSLSCTIFFCTSKVVMDFVLDVTQSQRPSPEYR